MRRLPLVLAAATLLAACNAPSTDAPATAAAPAEPAAVVPEPVAPTPDKWLAAPPMQVAVLSAPGTDSPFSWKPATEGAPRTKVVDGTVWAPAADVVAVMKPGATFAVADGQLQVEGKSIAAQVEGEDAWVPVGELALALGGLARTNPVNGAVALWPASELQWLAANGDQRAPVLAEARAAGLVK